MHNINITTNINISKSIKINILINIVIIANIKKTTYVYLYICVCMYIHTYLFKLKWLLPIHTHKPPLRVTRTERKVARLERHWMPSARFWRATSWTKAPREPNTP